MFKMNTYVNTAQWNCSRESVPCNGDADCTPERCGGGGVEPTPKIWMCFDYGGGIRRCAEKKISGDDAAVARRNCDPLTEITMFRSNAKAGVLEQFCAPRSRLMASPYFLPRGAEIDPDTKQKRCKDENEVFRIEMPYNQTTPPVYYFTCFPGQRPHAGAFVNDPPGHRLFDQLMAVSPHYNNIFPMRGIKSILV